MQELTTTPKPAATRGWLPRALLACALAALGACTMPGLPFFGKSTAQSTSTRTETHTVNGQPVDPDDEEAEAPRHRKHEESRAGAKMGATCHHNSDCASDTCFVGAGDLGYCTKMCDSFSDCPSFWECDHVGNAPQRICMQDD